MTPSFTPRALALLLAALTAATGPATPTSADPARSDATDPARARAAWERADAELNAAYGELKGRLAQPARDRLRAEQLEWIRSRDWHAREIARNLGAAQGAPDLHPAYWETMTTFTAERTRLLRVYDGRGVPPGLDGRYTDGYGGTLTVTDADRRAFRFRLDVVRGPTAHTGEIEGTATLAGARATFASGPASDGKPCVLRFEIEGNRIAVRGQNTSDFHGARASFDGVYFKMGAPVLGRGPGARRELPAHRPR